MGFNSGFKGLRMSGATSSVPPYVLCLAQTQLYFSHWLQHTFENEVTIVGKKIPDQKGDA